MSSRLKVSSGSEPSSVDTVPTMPPVLESPSTAAETVQPRTRPGPLGDLLGQIGDGELGLLAQVVDGLAHLVQGADDT